MVDAPAGPDWRARLAHLRDDIEANDRVTLTRCTFRDPVQAADLEMARRHWGGSLPDALEQFYSATDGFVLEWEAVDPAGLSPRGPHAGSINILPLADVFGDWKDIIWFDDWEGGDRFRGVMPFDLFAPEAAAALYQRLGEAPLDRIYSHYLGETLDESSCTIEEYLELLLESRGYYYWVRALPEATRNSPSARAFAHDMTQLFPRFRSEAFGVSTEG